MPALLQMCRTHCRRGFRSFTHVIGSPPSNGTVVVTGTVSSWSEHDAALAAAWAAPGVTSVDDEIVVAY